MTVSYETYRADKEAFLKKHPDWTVDTSSMDEYGRYSKQYMSTDGAIFTEEMYPCWETAEAKVELHGVIVTLKDDIKFMRIEYYSTDDSQSRYYYERW